MSRSSCNSLSRFIIKKKGNYNETERIIHYRAFMPNENLKVSVFCTDELNNDEIWFIGDEYIAPTRGRPLARADIVIGAIIEVGLGLDSDNIPPLHANITGWSQDKSRNMLYAKELAYRASLHLRS